MIQQEFKMKETRSFVNCCICKQNISDKHRFVELAMNYGVICQECDKKFNDDEIEFISNIFNAFGGYFGARKGISETKQILKKLLNLHKEDEKIIDINALDIKLLHQALLHGISPRQIVQKL